MPPTYLVTIQHFGSGMKCYCLYVASVRCFWCCLIVKSESILFTRRLVWTIVTYIVLTFVWGDIAYSTHQVTAKALGFGLIANLRYLIFFLITWSVALRMSRLRANYEKIIVWPAIAVIIFGLLQIFILPNDFLKHFGYGPTTIPFLETINSNQHYVRIASTTRGANPLGAYLIIPITLMSALILKGKRKALNYLFLVGALIVLFYTFSRSAWLGMIISIVSLFVIAKLSKKYQKYFIIGGVTLIIASVLVFIGLKNNPTFQNYVYHTQTHSLVKTTSDQNHVSALETGLKGILKDPLGKGPGTAGPASIYNNNKARNTENYYIQIGLEVGWLGLFLFLLINIGVGYILWLKRKDPLALFLLASLIGISFVNFFGYAWSDDTLAYIWWGLAGVAMAPDIFKRKNHITTIKEQDVS